ncbi:hypothetical protein B4Q13_15565, partial [Lacticaseibacillus rhamnosus]
MHQARVPGLGVVEQGVAVDDGQAVLAEPQRERDVPDTLGADVRVVAVVADARMPGTDVDVGPGGAGDPVGDPLKRCEDIHALARLGDQAQWLIENGTLRSMLCRGQVIGVELPQFVELQVREVEPSAKSDTASGSQTKAATLVTGAVVRVPIYLKEGE